MPVMVTIHHEYRKSYVEREVEFKTSFINIDSQPFYIFFHENLL